MAGWDFLPELLRAELKQRSEEGCDVTGFESRIEESIASGDEKRINDVYAELMALPVRPDFPFREPSDLPGIRRLRPEGPRRMDVALSERDWSDKFLGAWLGRCAGCTLGKPLESGPFMGGSAGNPGWKNVQTWFEGADAWPISGYTPGSSRAEAELGLFLSPWCRRSQRENIRFMESDDDIRYTVLGLILLEEKGQDLDTWDVGRHWHRRLAYGQVCTAETHAYLNFAQVTSHMNGQKPGDWQARLEWVRTYHNPYREWIGAQIRADGWAYAAAASPELAAELAWRDASFSHVKNGVYGEMYIAAMIAAAFVENDIRRIVEIGLSEIPATSRLAQDIRQAVAIAASASSQVELVDRIWEAFKHYHPVHTINNAALVTAALVYSKGDFETAIATAVLGGWDTDCNGATAGSIAGARLGAAALPRPWVGPLNDTLYAEVNGFHPIAISECAHRSQVVFNNLRKGWHA